MSIQVIKVVDIADQIHRELGSPTDLSISAIAFWVRTNVGTLNNMVNQNFRINDSYEIDRVDPDNDTLTIDIDINAISVFKKMYMVHYYDNKIRSTLAAASTDSVVELSSDGSSIRKINKNEQGKTYATLKKMEYEELNYLANAYKAGEAIPVQVAGNDTIEGDYNPYRGFNRINKVYNT
jgi:hypothetical protein